MKNQICKFWRRSKVNHQITHAWMMKTVHYGKIHALAEEWCGPVRRRRSRLWHWPCEPKFLWQWERINQYRRGNANLLNSDDEGNSNVSTCLTSWDVVRWSLNQMEPSNGRTKSTNTVRVLARIKAPHRMPALLFNAGNCNRQNATGCCKIQNARNMFHMDH